MWPSSSSSSSSPAVPTSAATTRVCPLLGCVYLVDAAARVVTTSRDPRKEEDAIKNKGRKRSQTPWKEKIQFPFKRIARPRWGEIWNCVFFSPSPFSSSSSQPLLSLFSAGISGYKFVFTSSNQVLKKIWQKCGREGRRRRRRRRGRKNRTIKTLKEKKKKKKKVHSFVDEARSLSTGYTAKGFPFFFQRQNRWAASRNSLWCTRNHFDDLLS